MYLLYNPDGSLVGKTFEGADNSVFVPDAMWPEIAADITAFKYDDQSDSVILRTDYEIPVETDVKGIESLLAKFSSTFYVEDLDIELSFSGEFGAMLTAAIACASYSSPTIIGRRDNILVSLRINEGDAHSIASAYAATVSKEQS